MIKKILIIMILPAAVFFESAFSQNLLKVKKSQTAHIYVINKGSISASVKIKRIENVISNGSVNFFCWDVCYPPGTATTTGFITIAPGDTSKNFYGDYDLGTSVDSSDITYCFYNKDNSVQSTCANVIYGTQWGGKTDSLYAIISIDFTTGISEISSFNNKINRATPNPADDYTVFSYNLIPGEKSAFIIIRNMLGAVVHKTKISSDQKTVTITTSDLLPGIYFYSLEIENELQSVKRLIVSR